MQDPTKQLVKNCPNCGRCYGLATHECEDDGTVLLVSEPDRILGTTLDNRYKILAIQGDGGWGTVYKARHEALNSIVALKVLHRHLMDSDEREKRFEQEAQACCGLRQENVVSVLDYGRTPGGQPYYVMEFIDGKPLDELIHESGTLSQPRTVNIIKQICAALTAAHKQGIVHRDIKPSNILVSQDENHNDKVKVVDFGLAKIISENNDAHVTATGQTIGTPIYMSPEQCRGLDVDGRTDIYSLGCLIYECLVGIPPFRGESPYDYMHQHISANPAPFSKVAPAKKIVASMEAVVMKCLEKNPDDRFSSIEELSAALDNLGQSPSLSFKFRSLARAMPKNIALPTAAVLVVLTAGLMALVYVAGTARHKTEKVPPVIQQPRQMSSADLMAAQFIKDNLSAHEARFPAGTTDAGLQDIDKLTYLRDCDLSQTMATTPSFAKLAKCRQLQGIVLPSSPISTASLDEVNKIRELATFEVKRNTSFDSNSLKHLTALNNLRSVIVDGTAVSDLSMISSKTMPYLHTLSVCTLSRSLNSASMAGLSSLSHLTVVAMENDGVTPAHIEPLTHCPSLTQLDLSDNDISIDTAREIGKLKGLTLLNVSYGSIDDRGVACLKDLPLRFLSLTNSQVGDKGVNSVADNMPNLELLWVNNTSISDAAMPEIGKLTKLTSLIVGPNRITDKGIASLSNLKNLKVFDASSTKITDKSIETISKLSNLERLYLRDIKITDKSVPGLSKLKHLRMLQIEGTEITPKGIEPLLKLPSLSELYLPYACQADVPSFREKNPRCRYYLKGQNEEGLWEWLPIN